MAPETPKAVSSRLLTMKFMQRAVASTASSPDTESHSSKKRKLGHSPAQGRVSTLIDQASIQAALESQEAKRQAALAQHSAADTPWVLNAALDKSRVGKAPDAPLNIVYVGYGDIDSSNESGGEDAPQSGRMSTRKPKKTEKQKSRPERRAERRSHADDDTSEDSSGDSDASGSKRKGRDSDAGQNSQDRASRSRSRSKSKLSRENLKTAKGFREKRKKKEVRLNQITSISSGGGSSPSLTCHSCKQPGHKASNCPKGGSQGSRKL